MIRGARLGRDPESVHEMRVAVRRARALLRVGQPLYRSDVGDLNDGLRFLARLLGRVRDAEVMLERLRSAGDSLEADDRTAIAWFLRALEGERWQGRVALLGALNDGRYLALLDRLDDAIETLAPAGSPPALEELAALEVRKLHKRIRRLGDDPGDDDLHSLRKAVKRARYAFELAGGAQGVKRAKALQDVLGSHQDSVVAEQRLRELARSASAAEALAAGRLIEREHALRREARKEWRPAWRRLAPLN
jgi:CHAD domain-containing protein